MNEITFFIAVIVTVAICAGLWNLVRELFTRWVNNDWCKHEWGMWEAVSSVSEGSSIHRQYRFCKKCNMAQRRIL